jgi:hypothetical protein
VDGYGQLVNQYYSKLVADKKVSVKGTAVIALNSFFVKSLDEDDIDLNRREK